MLPRLRPWRARSAACLLAGAFLVALSACGGDDPKPQGQDDSALERFYSQRIDWRACPAPNPSGSRCGTLRVPRNYDDPDGEEWKIAVAKLPATGGSGKGAIVTNPGGPGISGVEDLLAHPAGWDRLRTEFDLIGFDPRGVGASPPGLDCMTPELRDAIRNQGSSPEGEAQRRRAVAVAGRQAKLCESAGGGILGDIGTRDVARDMDVLRAELGQEKLDYFGFSYGTYLGATYADIFPERVDRFVLDSVMDPANDYEQLRHGQALAQQRSIERFIADCLGRRDCPLSGGADRAQRQLLAIVTQLNREPVTARDGRVVSGLRMQNLIDSSMYTPESGWAGLRGALAAARSGDREALAEAAYGPGQLVNPADSPYLAVMCHDLSTSIGAGDIPELAEKWRAEAPITGANRAWSVLPCAIWPARSDQEPKAVTAEGSGDILVLGVSGDPSTPVEWARNVAASLENGHLLVWDGDGHIASGRGGACIDDAVQAFFVEGDLPPEGTVCPA